ncbi:hypothetical protein HMPREF1430_01401 [Helicobacter pylori GAM96Ai]|uniref:hypothetical protein n=1 Tax=Helicobacter pylori TaxID=210 RepID=UPI0002BA19CD|nr:hypothetical protein [Helicobacter pylori]EMH40798.1 hypothetical protein HMPREF1430_01401 [Helicobacter pylori GAM96Ai]
MKKLKNETQQQEALRKNESKMLLIKDFKAKMAYTQTQKDNNLGQALLKSFKA